MKLPGLQARLGFPAQGHRSLLQLSQSQASTAAVHGGDAVAPGTWRKDIVTEPRLEEC